MPATYQLILKNPAFNMEKLQQKALGNHYPFTYVASLMHPSICTVIAPDFQAILDISQN